MEIMSKIQTEILNAFFVEISGKEEITDEMLTSIKALFLNDKKPKTDDLVKIFLKPEDEIL